jgi:hypothetical protein
MLLSVSVEASMLFGIESIALWSCRVTNVFGDTTDELVWSCGT